MKLVCEYSKSQIGLENTHPRFSWKENEEYGMQKKYRIIVSKSSILSDPDLYVWDTGKVESRNSSNIVYDGVSLESLQTYYYQVTIWNEDDKESKSEIQHFTMGILDQKLWNSSWCGISGMNVMSSRCRSEFYIKKAVKSAYAIIATANYFVMTVNGQPVTDSVLNAMTTDPEKSVPYRMFDISNLVGRGKNTYGVELGRGWPGLVLSLEGDGIGELEFLSQTVVIYEDGEIEWIYSNAGDWSYTMQTPIVYDSIYHGETYDARLEMPGWDCNDYDMDKSSVTWQKMVEFEPLTGKLVSQQIEPIKVVQEIHPLSIIGCPDGSWTLDFGQNFAGWIRLRLQGAEGQKITIRYAELLHEDGTLNTISLRRAKATDTYICSGKEEEIYEPRFTYHGFRYVNLMGFTEEPEMNQIIGCVVHSDVERIGHFHTDNELLNQLYSNVMWTEVSNLHGIPTDCPQRDERLAWTNDMTVRNECALYNFNLSNLYTKWMGDIRDSQGIRSGALTDTAPFYRYGSRPSDPVAVTPIILPWNVYLFQNDLQIIQDNYEMNRKWMSYLQRNAVNHILYFSQMGDWAGPLKGTQANIGDGVGGGAVSTITPTALMATASYYQENLLMAKMARLLHQDADEKAYLTEAEIVKNAFIETFYHWDKHYFASGSQGSNTMALYSGLVPEEEIPYVVKNLVDDIENQNQVHLTTGNICSRYIIEVLFEHGYKDLAFQLLTQVTYPSWGYMVSKGATTMWERWEEVTDQDSVLAGMASRNHPMNGAFAVSFFKYLAGIRPVETSPGFQEVKIKPYVPNGLHQIQASVDTVKGKVVSEWNKTQKQITFTIEIPFNCKGSVSIPCNDTDHVSLQTKDKKYDLTANSNIETICYCKEVNNGYFELEVGPGSYQIIVKK